MPLTQCAEKQHAIDTGRWIECPIPYNNFKSAQISLELRLGFSYCRENRGLLPYDASPASDLSGCRYAPFALGLALALELELELELVPSHQDVIPATLGTTYLALLKLLEL